MFRSILFLLLVLFQVSCSSSEVKEESISKDTIASIVDTSIVVSEIFDMEEEAVGENMEVVNFDFLSDCDSLEMWLGTIQGIDRFDSTGPFIMAQCFANMHYDLIVYSSSKLELNNCANYKENRIVCNVSNVEYYAFQIPKKVPENPENEFDVFDYVYPSEVKIYKLFGKGWYQIDQQTINSFEELGRLKLKTIHTK
ncbi:MAG: hypothetical protein U0U66_05405 [Cytophagaceae bacterium]